MRQRFSAVLRVSIPVVGLLGPFAVNMKTALSSAMSYSFQYRDLATKPGFRKWWASSMMMASAFCLIAASFAG
jgi:hypothetical protein